MGGQVQSDVGRAENPERPSAYRHAASLMAEARETPRYANCLACGGKTERKSEKMRRENG